jgi:hypothetical protein
MADVEGKVPAAPTLAGLPDCLALLLVSSLLAGPGGGAAAGPPAGRPCSRPCSRRRSG